MNEPDDITLDVGDNGGLLQTDHNATVIRELARGSLKRCEECDATFRTFQERAIHGISVHGGRAFPCRLCSNDYDSMWECYEHMLYNHVLPGIIQRGGSIQTRSARRQQQQQQQQQTEVCSIM